MSTPPAVVPLGHGEHSRPEPEKLAARDPNLVEACVMERVYLRWAFREGMPLEEVVRGWTDHVACVSPIIAAMCRSFNDRVGHGERGDARRAAVFTEDVQDALIGTAGSAALETRRRFAMLDWTVREATPKVLAATTSLSTWGPQLLALDVITDEKSYEAALSMLWRVRDEAWRTFDARWRVLRKKAEAAEAAAAEAAAAAAEAAAEAEAEAAAAEAAAAYRQIAETLFVLIDVELAAVVG